MYNLENKIKVLLTKNKKKKKKLAVSIKISARTIHNIFSTNESNTKILKNIADYYNVPISYFFEEMDFNSATVQKNLVGNNNVLNSSNVNIGANEIALKKEIEFLKEKIESLNSQLAKCEANNDFFKKLLEKKE